MEISQHLTSLTIDHEIKETATQTLEEYTTQVETANAIEERLGQLAEEMTESEQSAAVRIVVAECLEFVSFESAFPLVADDFLESLLKADVAALADGGLTLEQT